MLVRNAGDYSLWILITPLRLSGRKRPFTTGILRSSSETQRALVNYMCTSWNHEKGSDKRTHRLSGKRALILNLKHHWSLQPRHSAMPGRRGEGTPACGVRKFHLEKRWIISPTFLWASLQSETGEKNTGKYRSDSGTLSNNSNYNNKNNNSVAHWLPLFPLLDIKVWEAPKLYYQTVLLHMLGSLIF